MKINELSTWLIMAVLAAPAATLAQSPRDDSASAPAPARSVKPAEEEEEAGLLLPAVQKVREAAPAPKPSPAPSATPARIQAQPQKGIEPDEIDAKLHKPGGGMTGQSRRRDAADVPSSSGTAKRQLSTRQMMAKLKPRTAPLVTARPAGTSSSGAASSTSLQQPKPAEPPRYEIADCGTPSSPMICCHHEDGDGSSCNLFMILCGNAGGTAQGNDESAACSDWD